MLGCEIGSEHFTYAKQEEYKRARELATVLGCDESTIYRWFRLYQSQGMTGLLQFKTPPGKPSKLPPEVLERLQMRLQERQGFSSYGEIQQWLATECNCDAAYQTVHGIVRYKLKSKLKEPRPLSVEADPQLQETFKKNFGSPVHRVIRITNY
ncbi:helix-turn-helix domain-containing protein [Chroococcidiopsis sp. FACHB-1243]|uniref:helix-turn-helix domain-containing protein n=1 Tax=Chroococcidiopsis sp. [FACHB-1243] TaxID=2692781 RepID=UPI00177B83E9|nr:helix-turn-helix domain-containing protein [Chroococcidiopsis sp. [FACHB-1243]]MBD2307248.1 helix-turn-helix domain-containing protein [Chroococcidiopsis sp. [FACHB-1243]]